MKKIPQLSKRAHKAIMKRAAEIDGHSPEICREFSILYSALHPKTLLLRWLSIDLADEDCPHQCYLYECFDLSGRALHCSVHYDSPSEAEAFYKSLQPLETPQAA